MDAFSNIRAAICDLEEDSGTPKHIRAKLANAITLIDSTTEVSLTVSKILSELEEVASDTATQSYTRTQLYTIVSLLESL